MMPSFASMVIWPSPIRPDDCHAFENVQPRDRAKKRGA